MTGKEVPSWRYISIWAELTPDRTFVLLGVRISPRKAEFLSNRGDLGSHLQLSLMKSSTLLQTSIEHSAKRREPQ